MRQFGRFFVALALGVATPAASQPLPVEARAYGVTAEGEAVREFSLRNARGMVVRFLNYGGIITAIEVPDRDGRVENVALGFADLDDYAHRNGDYFGALVGRYAGRIADARFTLDGREYRLSANDGPHALHGGSAGFEKRLWEVRPFEQDGAAGAVLRYVSPAGEQGFPGELEVEVTYTLLPSNELRIDFEARTDAPTVLNLTSHGYFNLAGAGSGTVLDHLLEIAADSYAETNEGGIPTGRFNPVAGTPFDFTSARPTRAQQSADHPQMEGRRGFNHSWILGGDGGLAQAATLSDPASGRRLDVLTTEPSIHIYTGGWLGNGGVGAQGRVYGPHEGIALETQHLPDSPNQPDFPSTVLRPGETFRSTTIFRFGFMDEDGG
ncbi:MAG: aldose epimerase family protein [Allosphingosinicella sp.]|uniref:aldose epimerase family protein n=1 Tax=Allosphingosinicella sp. TaxID=2823234 RepID=UPI0039238E2F